MSVGRLEQHGKSRGTQGMKEGAKGMGRKRAGAGEPLPGIFFLGPGLASEDFFLETDFGSGCGCLLNFLPKKLGSLRYTQQQD